MIVGVKSERVHVDDVEARQKGQVSSSTLQI